MHSHLQRLTSKTADHLGWATGTSFGTAGQKCSTPLSNRLLLKQLHIQNLLIPLIGGELSSVVTLLDWLEPFLTVEEQLRLLGWHLGVIL